VLERALGDLARRGPFLAHEEPLVGQESRRDLPPPRPQVVSRDDEDQLVVEARGQALLAGVKRVSAHHPEIDLVPADALLDHRGAPDLQAQRDPGMALLEQRDHGREHVDPRRGAGPDEQRSALEAGELGDSLPSAGERGEQAEGVVLEDAPRLGECHGPPEAVEQPSPQLPLQLGHVLRERRLAQVQDLGGAAEALRPGHARKTSNYRRLSCISLILSGR